MSCYQSWVVNASCMDGFFSRPPPRPQLVQTVDESLGRRWVQCEINPFHALYKICRVLGATQLRICCMD